MKATTKTARTATKLREAAEEFVKIADAATTLEECDAWNRDAETLRVTAHLLTASPSVYDVTASSFLHAAGVRIHAAELAVHESRAARRQGAL